MATKRQQQTAELIRRNFGIVLQQEGSYIYGAEILVTVTAVKMSPDLGIAKIYMSVYNTENKQAVILKLQENITRLRQVLGQRVRKHVRRIPSIQFYLDETLDEMYRLNELFNGLEKDSPAEQKEEDETSLG